ncbi:MAG TPA: M48 family metalloprotease [Fimbriimonadaceae bacterium]|nr:M48 family metalloprotease [Fimbriimonadaceae bacterium]
MKRSLALPLVALAALSMSTVANAQFGKPSKEQQVKLGLQAASDLRSKAKVLPPYDERVKVLRRVAGKILATFDDKGQPWQYSFDVIDDKEVNAFSLPGGPTFFYTGLLDKLMTEDELAAVLGHELTHVRKEHWAYQYRDQQQKGLLLDLGLILMHANRNTADLASIGLDVLVNLPYSRKHESEADEGGYEAMIKAGYNPEGMADVFRLLKSIPGSKPPPFLSDHPADNQRIQRIEDMIHRGGRKYKPQIPLPWSR